MILSFKISAILWLLLVRLLHCKHISQNGISFDKDVGNSQLIFAQTVSIIIQIFKSIFFCEINGIGSHLKVVSSRSSKHLQALSQRSVEGRRTLEWRLCAIDKGKLTLSRIVTISCNEQISSPSLLQIDKFFIRPVRSRKMSWIYSYVCITSSWGP